MNWNKQDSGDLLEEVEGLMSVKESTNLKYWKKRATNQGLGTHFV
jgi:hypothetical protein